MAAGSARIQGEVRFGEDFELDCRNFQLRRAGRVLKLERIPLEMLILLIERAGHLVTREEIAERIWGTNVFLDTDNSINSAIDVAPAPLPNRVTLPGSPPKAAILR